MIKRVNSHGETLLHVLLHNQLDTQHHKFVSDSLRKVLTLIEMDMRGHVLSVEDNNGDSVFGLVLDRAVVIQKTALKTTLDHLDPTAIMELLTPLLAALCKSVHVSVENTVEALPAVFQRLNTRGCFDFLILKLENDLTLAYLCYCAVAYRKWSSVFFAILNRNY